MDAVVREAAARRPADARLLARSARRAPQGGRRARPGGARRRRQSSAHRPLLSARRGRLPDPPGPYAVRAGSAVVPAVRHPLRRTGLSCGASELPGDGWCGRRGRRFPPLAQRAGRRPRGGRLAARTAVVRRALGHRRPQLSRVRAVGAGPRSAAGAEGHGGAGGAARSVRPLPHRRRPQPGDRARRGRRHDLPAPGYGRVHPGDPAPPAPAAFRRHRASAARGVRGRARR